MLSQPRVMFVWQEVKGRNRKSRIYGKTVSALFTAPELRQIVLLFKDNGELLNCWLGKRRSIAKEYRRRITVKIVDFD